MSSRSLLSINFPREILTALTRNGYETAQDVLATDLIILAEDLAITLEQADDILSRCRLIQTPATSLNMTQSAALMLQQSQLVQTGYVALDAMLDGGLTRGHILEISGPPGSPKEKLIVKIASGFAEAEEGVLFVDCANMTSSSILGHSLQRGGRSKIHYTKIHSLSELLLLLHQLPRLLCSLKASVLIINSISFPFQSLNISASQRVVYLDRVKHHFAQLSASKNLTIVTSSQLSTKMINMDGTRATYDTGGRGIMLPQLGPAYLPTSKSHRILLWPNDPTSGSMKLLSSPKYPPGKVPIFLKPYSIVDGVLV